MYACDVCLINLMRPKNPSFSKLNRKEEAYDCFILASYHYKTGGSLWWVCLAADMWGHIYCKGSNRLVTYWIS